MIGAHSGICRLRMNPSGNAAVKPCVVAWKCGHLRPSRSNPAQARRAVRARRHRYDTAFFSAQGYRVACDACSSRLSMVLYSTARHFWPLLLDGEGCSDSSFVQESLSKRQETRSTRATSVLPLRAPETRNLRSDVEEGEEANQAAFGACRSPVPLRWTRAAPAHWGLTVTPSGHLACDSVSLASLRGEVGFSATCSLARRLRENASEFLAVNGGRTRAEVYYSYKSNPVPGVLQLFHGLGIGAEVISEYEIWLALKLGVPPSHRFQRAGEIDHRIYNAVAQDLLLINVNHREEMCLATAARALGKRPRIAYASPLPQDGADNSGCPWTR